MEKKTIDNLIAAKKNAVRLSGEIDNKYSADTISIVEIYNDIALLANTMKSDIDTIIVKKELEIIIENTNKQVALLRKFDEKARRINLYEYKIRPLLKEKFKYLKTMKIVDGRQLLNYHDEVFVTAIYQSLLERTPEESAIENALMFLSKAGNHKVDLIYSIYCSEEAKGKNVKLKGIRHQKLLLELKRKIYAIPIVGYIARLFINIILLPKKLINYQECLNVLICNIKNNNINLESLNADVLQLQLELKEKNEELSMAQHQYASAQIKFDAEIAKMKEEINSLQYNNEMLLKIEQYIVAREQETIQNELRQKDIKILLDNFYVKYNEKLLPDSRASVQTGYAIYINKLNSVYPNIENRTELNILDLGCGEGEWLEVLLNNNYLSAIGVDNNDEVVKKTHKLYPHLKIIQNNAIEYLQKNQNNSVDVITSFHMVEHFELVELLEFLYECYRVLKSDGILIVETPNPQNLLIATYYFNLDPTHKKPIPPELLEFIVQECGFINTEKIFLRPLNFEPYEYKDDDPIKDIVFRFNLEQSYAIWAVKK